MYRLAFLLAIIYLSSCASKNIAPEFSIGSSEKTWKDTIRSMVKSGKLKSAFSSDSFSFKYNFKIDNLSLPCIVMVNNDGIDGGKLRVLAFNFTNSEGIVKPNPNSTDSNYPTPKEDSILFDQLSWERAFVFRDTEGRINSIGSQIYPKVNYDKLYEFIKKNYGNPDSILDYNDNRLDTINFTHHKVKDVVFKPTIVSSTNEDSEPDFSWLKGPQIDNSIDTSNLRFYFHDSKSIIVIERSQLFPAHYYIPFPHYNEMLVYQYSKGYENELKEAQKEVLKTLQPKDLITIPMNYSVETKSLSYGFKETYVTLSANLEPMLRKTLAEERDIESLKGSVLISDKYGTLIQEVGEVEIASNGSLISRGKPGLLKAIGKGDRLMFRREQFTASLNVRAKQSTTAFKNAVAMNYDMSIVFVPDAIRFADGSILK